MSAIHDIALLRCDPDSANVYAAFSHPGLALPIIGTVLRDAGYRVRIFVDAIRPPRPGELDQADLIGLTVNSACFQESYRTADRLRGGAGGRRVMFGGPHVTHFPEEALRHGDFVVRGEGEATVLELVRAIDQGCTDFGHIRGLSWRDAGGAPRHNPDRELVEDIDLVPDQSLIAGYREHMRRWTQRLFPSGMLVSTSRGCPHRCTFCTIPGTFGTVLRFRSDDAVVADIRRQTAFSGHRYVYFADDNFTAHPRRTKQLLRRIVDERLDIRFSAQIRADVCADPELMDLLQAAGCYLAFVGFESINEATLRAYKKGIRSLELLERSVGAFHDHGIMVHGMFVIGSPEDAPGTALRTADWALAHGMESLQMLPLCPLPGTETLAELEASGRVYKSWDPERMEAFIPYAAGSFVLHEPERMTAVELQQELLAAYRRFYRGRNILRALWRVGRWGLEPVLYRAMGRYLLRRSEPQIEDHVRWLQERQITLCASDHAPMPASVRAS